MAMFGLDAEARQRVMDTIKETLETFGVNYLASFKIAFCNNLLESSFASEDEKDEWALTQAPDPSPPDHKGFMEKQSSILKSWKKKYFSVNDKYELSFSSGPDKKEEDVINLWGYKSQKVNEKPSGKRKGGPEWVDDADRTNCKACEKPFTVTNRRHHCRACGELFCGDCTENRLPLFHFGYDKPERVCQSCFATADVGRGRTDTFTPVQPEDKEDQTFFGISLLHKYRTPITLRCESKESRDTWHDVITICIANAQLPINPDPVFAEAFESAYQETAWQMNYRHGWWRVTGSESEMLGDLLASVITERVIDAIINGDKIPAKLKKTVEEAMQKQVRLLITAGVGPAWRALLEQIAKLRDVVEEAVKKLLEPVKEAKQKVIDKVTGAVIDTVKPLVTKVSGPIMDQVIKLVMEPLLEAHASVYRITAQAVVAIRDDVKNEADKKAALEKAVDRQLSRVRGDWGDFYPVWRNLDKLWDSLYDLKSKADGQLDSINVSDTVREFNHGLHAITRNALWTIRSDEQLIGELANADSSAAVNNAFKRMAQKLSSDSEKELNKSFVKVLMDGILPAAQKAVMENEAVAGLLEPIDAVVPDAVKDYISASACLDALLENLVTEAVKLSVTSGLSNAGAHLKEEMNKAMQNAA